MSSDNEDMTPLHWSVSGGHQDCVKLLISKNASINTIALFCDEGSEHNRRVTPMGELYNSTPQIAPILYL